MPRFFIPQSAAPGDLITLNGDDARHICGSLRMTPGQPITLCGSSGDEYRCLIETADKTCVTARVSEITACMSEPSVRVNLFAALSKGDKFEHVLQKSVELGVFSITPFVSERCISRPDSKAYAAKHLRYQKIIAEAAKQCGRGIIPQLMPVQSFNDAVLSAAQADIPVFLYENETDTRLNSVLSAHGFFSVSLMSGPEGGFAPSEAEFAAAHGLLSVSLGKRILRCETAPLAALTAVMYHSGNF